MTRTIVLIHGAWLTPLAWDGFRTRFEAAGYKVIAPPWPYMDRPVEDLRGAPHPDLASLGIKQIVDHYDAQIRGMDEPPILMGHSFGGLICQLLLDRGLGAVGVAFDPAPPRGVVPRLTTICTSAGVFFTWGFWRKVMRMSLKEFSTGFAQTLPEKDKAPAYERYIVPAPGRIFFQGAFGIDNGIAWKSPTRPPLLIIEGAEDRTADPAMVRSQFRKQSRAPSPF